MNPQMKKTFGFLAGITFVVASLSGCTFNFGTQDGHSGMGMDAMHSEFAGDVMFAQMMIPHHEQAVEMANLAATRALDPTIVSLAAQIKAAQGPEIELMVSWLDEWGFPRMAANQAMSAHGGHGMAGMLTSEQLKELAASTGANFDRLFAQAMIEHHEGAISMARDVLSSGSDPRVASLAKQIIETQQSEIIQLQEFLNR